MLNSSFYTYVIRIRYQTIALEVWKGGSVKAEIGRSRVGCPRVQCMNLHELDLRFNNYAENVALLRTGFYDSQERMVELFTNRY